LSDHPPGDTCLSSQQAEGCTTFLLKDAKGNIYFGRNFDFPLGEGRIQINERNMVKNAMVMPPEQMETLADWFLSVQCN